jgi:hypothetical protein
VEADEAASDEYFYFVALADERDSFSWGCTVSDSIFFCRF